MESLLAVGYPGKISQQNLSEMSDTKTMVSE
jgi:hypothetical protein